MFKLIRDDGKELEFDTLDGAMKFAKMCGTFMTIKGDDFEVVGVFGVDTVAEGKCPDGIEYDWNKSSRIGEPKRR